jgi:toxin ParE1/3/4
MEIIWQRIAREDLEAAQLYIANYDQEASDRVRNAIITAVERLAELPDLGRPGRVDDTREWVVSQTPYIIAYTVAQQTLVVLSVMHGARLWPEGFDGTAAEKATVI